MSNVYSEVCFCFSSLLGVNFFRLCIFYKNEYEINIGFNFCVGFMCIRVTVLFMYLCVPVPVCFV